MSNAAFPVHFQLSVSNRNNTLIRDYLNIKEKIFGSDLNPLMISTAVPVIMKIAGAGVISLFLQQNHKRGDIYTGF